MWTRELHKQDHLHVNFFWHCMGCKRKFYCLDPVHNQDNLKDAQQRGLHVCQTRSNLVFFKTHCLQSPLSDTHEERKSALSRRKRDIETACFSESQFAKWFSRSICTRSKIILGVATRCGELRGDPKQHCWLQNSRCADLDDKTTGTTTN